MKGDFSRDTFAADKHYSRVLMQQGRVQLDSDWNEQQSIHHHRIATATKDVVGMSGAPLRDAGFQIGTADGKALNIGRGRYYVEGILCENEADTPYLNQPDFPNAPDVIALLTSVQATAAIIYLDVWHRHVTAIDDPLMRETALGGPDTTARVKTVWQVKALPAKPDGGGAVSCGDTLPDWDTLIAPSSGMLSARSQPTPSTDNPCLLPPSARYRRLENQLYRIEIHQGGTLGAATFKWSRDNGAVVTAVESVNGLDLTVRDLGRDDVLGFAGGQWVELTDDVQELSGRPGQLLQIDRINPATRVITLKAAPTAVNLTRHPKLRRWDSASATIVAVPATNSGFIPLEDGVEVKFEAGSYRTGDYWLVPARTATGDVEWPFAAPQRPRGITHHYSRLAVATLGGGVLTLQDCRKVFSALADAPPALHVTGMNWVNDDVVSQDFIPTNGLQLFFDGALTPPPDGGAGGVVVTLEMPLVVKPGATAGDIITGQFGALLSGDISFPQPHVLLWKPARAGAEIRSLMAYLVTQQVTRVRMRYHLKGRTLWQDRGQTRAYVDGTTFGVSGARADGTPRIHLQLPSGDQRRASDFDSWLYIQLQLPTPNLTAVSLSAASVLAGQSVTGTATLDFPAPAAGLKVNLTSSAAQVTVPASVTVAAGATQAQFSVTTAATLASSISVIIGGFTTGTVPTQSAPLAVQVIAVTIAPVEMSLSAQNSQQFTATVTGSTSSTAVTWSVQEAGGGSVNSSGFYTAPATAGNFHVVATSVADTSKKATATIHVVPKQKDKEKEKEKEKEKDKEREKVVLEKAVHVENMPIFEGGALPFGGPPVADDAGLAPAGRAFIRSDERPEPTPETEEP